MTMPKWLKNWLRPKWKTPPSCPGAGFEVTYKVIDQECLSVSIAEGGQLRY
jgi:hypothetical protein